MLCSFCPRSLMIHSRLRNKLILRCMSQSQQIKASGHVPKTRPTIKNGDDKKILLFERNRNYWIFYRAAATTMWVVGIPLAANFLHLGWKFNIPKFMLAGAVLFFGGWFSASVVIMNKQVRRMEYQPSQKRVLITTMGKFGQPVVAKYKIGEALYDDTVAKKKRVYIKVLNNDYVLQQNKGKIHNEELLWKLIGRKDFDDV